MKIYQIKSVGCAAMLLCLLACGAGELDLAIGDCAGQAGCLGTLASATGGTVANETTAPVSDASASTVPAASVKFVTSQLIVREDIGQAAVLVWLSALTDHDVTVGLIVGGDGISAIDTARLNASVVIPAGSIVQSTVIPVLDNVTAEGDRRVQLLLTNPVGATLADPAALTLVIRDNDGVTATAPSVVASNTALALASGGIAADFAGGGGCSLLR